MKFRKALVALSLAVVLPTAAACTAAATTTSDGGTSSSQTSQAPQSADGTTGRTGRGPGGGVEVSAVTTEEQLISLIQEAYGDAGLGLHRGHEPVQDVLDEVLTISHDELHVRMEQQGQNLAAVATDVGVDPQTLINALVDAWSPAIDNLLQAGTITQQEADAYHEALVQAFTFRVTWDGQQATPTFSGLGA